MFTEAIALHVSGYFEIPLLVVLKSVGYVLSSYTCSSATHLDVEVVNVINSVVSIRNRFH